MRDHLFIPDRQVIPGYSNDIDYAIGNYIAKHQPQVIINIGDHADMASLSTYDVGKASAEGKRYKADIECSIAAHEIMFSPVKGLQERQRKNKEKIYDPETHICYGNHEDRITRAIKDRVAACFRHMRRPLIIGVTKPQLAQILDKPRIVISTDAANFNE